MKKLIMFIMVLAIAVPALATIEDVSPPVWGGTTPSANVVWQIDTEYGVPTCTAYDPSDDDPEFYFGSHEGGPTGTWNSEAGTFTLADGDFLHALVEVPGGSGSNLTIRVQTAIEGDPDFAETNLEIWASGKEDFAVEMATNAVEHPPGSGVWVQEGTFTPTTGGVKPWFADAGNIIGVLNGGPFTMTGMIIDVIRHDGDAPTSGPGRTICEAGLPNPIIIDPNVMLVYETGETEGDFGVSLLNEPPAGATITITVDPNEGGPSEDITLIGGSEVNGCITFDVNDSNWDVPQRIVFKAIDDEIAEPPNLKEPQSIVVTSSWPAHPTDANFVGEKGVTVNVMDNDQANILFSPASPIQRWEQTNFDLFGNPVLRKVKLKVTLQVQPAGDNVRVIVTNEGESGNQPIMDPPLLPEEPVEPNCLTFTPTKDEAWNATTMTSGWNVPQTIKIWGNDDDELQIEEAFAEGDENYQAYIVFRVEDDGGDTRYANLEQQVQIDIEDNECGAYGISYLDIGNPNAATDPNYRDEDGNPLPDCYVDIYDVIEFATQWLDCSDPQDPACESYR